MCFHVCFLALRCSVPGGPWRGWEELSWVMMCSALVWLMSESTFRARLARRRPEGRARRPHKRAEQISTTAARHLCRAHVMVSWVFRVAGGRYAAGVDRKSVV